MHRVLVGLSGMVIGAAAMAQVPVREAPKAAMVPSAALKAKLATAQSLTQKAQISPQAAQRHQLTISRDQIMRTLADRAEVKASLAGPTAPPAIHTGTTAGRPVDPEAQLAALDWRNGITLLPHSVPKYGIYPLANVQELNTYAQGTPELYILNLVTSFIVPLQVQMDVPDAPGTYIITFRVTDGDGSSPAEWTQTAQGNSCPALLALVNNQVVYLTPVAGSMGYVCVASVTPAPTQPQPLQALRKGNLLIQLVTMPENASPNRPLGALVFSGVTITKL